MAAFLSSVETENKGFSIQGRQAGRERGGVETHGLLSLGSEDDHVLLQEREVKQAAHRHPSRGCN